MRRFLLVLMVLFSLGVMPVFGQSQLAATLEVLNASVSVQRVNTNNALPVQFEAIVGVGDTIFTGEEGRARITFFADGTTTDLEPNTTYRIEEFSENEESFILRVTVIAGQTTQQLARILDSNSIYEIQTPGMTLAARGTSFAIRVEENGRSAMLVSEGNVDATGDDSNANVPPDYGIRAESESALSEVVFAQSFAQLDAALDGCSIVVTTADDVSLNVRIAPTTDAPIVTYVTADTIDLALGKTATGGWYRIAIEDGFGWILSTSATVGSGCAGLREFPNDFSEDPDQFSVNTTE